MSQGRYLFVSDLHLDSTTPAAITTFLDFIEEEARRSSGLFILGDLFESWIGDDDEDPSRRRVCNALRGLTAAGVPCRVQHGNRDFLLGAGFVARTGCELLPDPFTLQAGPHRLVLSHGDILCTEDVAYQRFRRVVRNRVIQRLWLALPLAARRSLADSLRQRSHRQTRAKPAGIMDVTPGAVAAMLRASDADMLIHGHTHRPGEHALMVDGRPRIRIVLGDWYEQGSLLIIHADGSHERRVLSATGARPAPRNETGTAHPG